MPVDEPELAPVEASLLTDPVPIEDTDGLEAPKGPDLPPLPTEAAPIETSARLDAVDVLRGVALLGILAMNIVGFAWPFHVYGTPTAAPGYTWADLYLWMVNHIVFDGKMMTIFSMLFGAGLVLMSRRAEARGASLLKLYYRRIGILLLIGLIHAYLIWEGDILVNYALCGLFLYPFRRRSARTLIVLGVVLLAMAVPVWLVGRRAISYLEETTRHVDAQVAAGEKPGRREKRVHDFWEGARKEMDWTPEDFEKTVRVHRGDYLGVVAGRAPELLLEQSVGFVLAFWWMVGGRMLLGMGLMKLGVFSAARSPGFYRRLALVGYGIGLPLVLADVAIDWHYSFFEGRPLPYFLGGWWLVADLSAPFMALGHVAIVMTLYQSGAVPWLIRRLAAVGRTALSNYLLTSIVCTTLFYGYGFGLYARLHRPALYGVVLLIWAVQLGVSLPWLTYFRFGPAEWAWRSLTYGRAQPFRLPASTARGEDLPGDLRKVAPPRRDGEIAEQIGHDSHGEIGQ